jgi:hypothetical protein
MSSQIDFRTLPANVPVLCIPRVYPNITESRIRRIFDDLNMGELERIDIVSKTSVKPGANPLEKGEKFNRVFVHFKRWNNSENSNLARERLLNGKEIKIIYDEPWFWKISAYREAATRRENAPQHHSEDRKASYARKPTIAFDSDEVKSSKPHYYSNRDDVPRRRDDSRERPRRDDRRYTTGYPLDRPRRRDDSRERPRHQNERREEMPVRKFDVSNESRTPQSSPPRERLDENTVIKTPIDYGNISFPKRKRVYGKKSEPKVLKIEKEDGEVSDTEEKKTENA